MVRLLRPPNWTQLLLSHIAQFHSSITAALMLVGKTALSTWPSWPKEAEILALTGASRSQSYHLAGRLRRLLPDLLGNPGRIPKPPTAQKDLLQISRAVQDYLLRNPGAASRAGRGHYSDGFRRFVVGLTEDGQPGQGLSVTELAEAIAVPLGTLKEWFSSDEPDACLEPAPAETAMTHHLHQIVSLYSAWKGTFQAFCKSVREQHRLKYGATFIGNLLHEAGVRPRKSRKASSAPWNRGTFQTLFPGAQWIADGTSICVRGVPVRWGEEEFIFNLELVIDAASNALVGAEVTDAEDHQALLSSFQDAVVTTGAASHALSVDNKPCNLCPEVTEALPATTTLLATTPGRGQSKAPVEGAFGLFSQNIPDLVVTGLEPREQARAVARLVFTAWARGRNGRPRRKLGDLSPADFYKSYKPSEEEVAEAKRWIQQLQERQEQIRRTREARVDPAKRALLEKELASLGIDDSRGRLAIDLAFYSRDAIVNGLGIFRVKQQLGTLPSGADLDRYLGGIIRNAEEQAELELLAEYFVRNREQLRDFSLRPLLAEAGELQDRPLQEQVQASLRRALQAEMAIDYNFWAAKCADALAALPKDSRAKSYRVAARKISVSYQCDRRRRQAILARLAAVVASD